MLSRRAFIMCVCAAVTWKIVEEIFHNGNRIVFRATELLIVCGVASWLLSIVYRSREWPQFNRLVKGLARLLFGPCATFAFLCVLEYCHFGTMNALRSLGKMSWHILTVLCLGRVPSDLLVGNSLRWAIYLVFLRASLVIGSLVFLVGLAHCLEITTESSLIMSLNRWLHIDKVVRLCGSVDAMIFGRKKRRRGAAKAITFQSKEDMRLDRVPDAKHTPGVDNACFLCIEFVSSVCSISCGHAIYCAQCYKETVDPLSDCPHCRKPISGYVRLIN